MKPKFLHIFLKHILPLLCGLIILILSFFINFTKSTKTILYILGLLFISYDIIIYTIRDIFIENELNENIFILLCILASYFMKYYNLCIAIVVLFKICYLIKDLYTKPYKKNIFSLLDYMPSTATIGINNELKNELPENISIGNIVLVPPNEIIPLDGIVVSGESTVDEYKLTGDKDYRTINVHDEVLNGSINLDNPIMIKVTREFINSTIIKIKNSISNGIRLKSKKISMTSKILNIYITTLLFIPIILLFIIPPFIKDFELMPHIITSLNYILVLSPLALALNIYISNLIIIKGLKKQKICVRDNIILENLSNVHAIIIDESFIYTPKSVDTLEKFKHYILDSKEKILEGLKIKYPIDLTILKHFDDSDNCSTTKIQYKNVNINIVACLPLPYIRSKVLKDIMDSKKNNSNVVFIGNGIQNIHLLCMADIGITSKCHDNNDIVNFASDISIENSDDNNDLINSINKLLNFPKHSKKTLLQNSLLCIIIKILVLCIYRFTNISILTILFIELASLVPIIFNCVRLINKK